MVGFKMLGRGQMRLELKVLLSQMTMSQQKMNRERGKEDERAQKETILDKAPVRQCQMMSIGSFLGCFINRFALSLSLCGGTNPSL